MIAISGLGRAYAALFAAVGWFATIGQYVHSNAHTFTSTVDFISFFTILSNILVDLTLTCAALSPESRYGRFLLRPTTATATALYITVTGVVFYFILSKIYDLTGWTATFNQLLHYVMPPAFVLFWLVFIPKGTLHVRNVPWMLIAPFAYAIYTLVRGPFADYYPYPFVDVNKLGYLKVFENVLAFVVFFSLIGCLYVLVDRLIHHFSRGGTAAAVRSS